MLDGCRQRKFYFQDIFVNAENNNIFTFLNSLPYFNWVLIPAISVDSSPSPRKKLFNWGRI